VDKRLIVIILIFVVLILVYITIIPKTTITDFYSSFTPHMEKYVTYLTRAIDCEPKQYYYIDSQLCFLCTKGKPCFEYFWVEREEGPRMSLKNISLTGYYDKQTEYAFYTFGISNLLNCKCIEDCVCEDGIKLYFEEITPPTGPVFIFPPNIKIESKIDKITKEWGITEECKTIRIGNYTEGVIKQINCGFLVSLVLNNTRVLFAI